MRNPTIVAKARREVQSEIRSAIAAKVERGTVVTTVGKWTSFTVEYLTFDLISGTKYVTKITIKGHTVWSVENAASAALYEWGLTR